MNQFAERHIGPCPSEIEEMFKKIGVNSLDELITQTIPANIRLDKSLDLPAALNESELLDHMKALGKKNKITDRTSVWLLQHCFTRCYSA